MRNKRKSKKGFTLMELSIVIALVAIVSVAAIGVCTLVSNITYENTVKNEIIQETTLLKKQVASIVNAYTDNIAYLDQEIKSNLNQEDFDRINLEELDFEMLSTNGNKYLWKCTVTLNSEYPFSEDNETFIFTVTKG